MKKNVFLMLSVVTLFVLPGCLRKKPVVAKVAIQKGKDTRTGKEVVEIVTEHERS